MSDTKQNKRVIWTLADGRKRYSCKRGEPELWSSQEIRELIKSRPALGAYTLPDCALHIADVRYAPMLGLQDSDIIRIVRYEVELAEHPIIDEYLW